MNRLLIIEDELSLQQSIREYLEELGYQVTAATGYCEALALMDQLSYDCVLVDLNLPDGDGLKLIRYARENQARNGMIIISARDTLDQRIEGLEAGADDYLVKPFHLAELGARVQSVIRRLRYDGDTLIRLGQLSVNQQEHILAFGERELELTPKETDILTYLISNKDRVISRESLAEHIWGDGSLHPASYDPMYTHIKNLRRKIQVLTGKDWLKTIYGVGYKLSELE